MTDLPPELRPFVLPVAEQAEVRTERVGEVDLYRPAGSARRGAILFVPGDPGPAGPGVPPHEWPVYQGYATAVAERGLVGAVAAHELVHGLDRLAAASDDVEGAVGVLRSDPQVDPNRIALWFFSGAGLLAGEWLDSRPEWLRCVLLSYPLLAAPPGVGELVSAAEVIGKPKDLPVLLTRVGREREELARPVAEFVSAGGTALDIIDVPKGQHGFDMLDHTDESRAAVTKALDWAIAHLGEDPTGTLPAAGTSTSTLPPTTSTTSTTSRPATTARPATAPARPATTSRTTAATTTAATTTAATASAAAASVPTTSVPAAASPAGFSFSDAAVPPATLAFDGATLTTPAVPVELPVPATDTPATRVVGRERAAYAAHDLEAFLALYSPTAQLQFADGSLLKGRRSLREYYRPRFEAGRCKTELLQRLTVGDWVVDQVVLHDTDQSPAPAITLYRVADGLIAEVRILA
ncbi:nuclear transport factor 2 family protein [Kribbella amoyensis]|nr:nuclear transport factor 2 family protein [Kribbella amoyensis]